MHAKGEWVVGLEQGAGSIFPGSEKLLTFISKKGSGEFQFTFCPTAYD